MSTDTCRYWVGSDNKGHRCNAPSARLSLCEKHYAVELQRAERQAQKDRATRARAEARWRERNLPMLPRWRVRLERAEAEYARRTAAPVGDRAAVGGAMHGSIVSAQRSHLSDTNVARVVELERIIQRLRADITRSERNGE